MLENAKKPGIKPKMEAMKTQSAETSFILNLIYSKPATSVRLLDRQRPLAAHPIGLPHTPPPDLVAINGRLLCILARIEEVIAIVSQDAVAVKGPARRPHAGRW